jgi:PAS domain S-box-containing protein
MLMVGEDGTIALANAQAESLFGCHKGGLLGRPVQALIPELPRGGHATGRAAPEVSPTGLGRDLLGRRTDGSEFPVEVAMSPFQTARGRFVLASVIDLTARRRAEDESRANRRELQLLTRRLLAAQEVERRRIARELHDDFNQGLALLTVELDLLGRQPPASDEQLAEQLRDLAARVKDLSSSVHDLSHQLHPAKLEQLGLVAAVRGLGAELYRHHGLEVTFTHHTVPDAVPEDVGLCLYRIVQEALRNVIKHSGTCLATVELTGAPDGLRLRVGDEGAGFDPAAARGGGLGLVSMRERLYLVGGEIEVRSRPGGGTRIDVRVPAVIHTRPDGERLCEAVGGS